MEGSNYVTTSDLALWNQHCDENKKRHSSGTAITALAFGVGGVVVGMVGLWGLNQASKARSEGASALASANAQRMNSIETNLLAERNSREGWQNANTPSIQSYIDVRATPSQTTTATAAAEALAYAMNGGLNSAVQSSNYLRVQPISVKDCGCGCNG